MNLPDLLAYAAERLLQASPEERKVQLRVLAVALTLVLLAAAAWSFADRL